MASGQEISCSRAAGTGTGDYLYQLPLLPVLEGREKGSPHAASSAVTGLETKPLQAQRAPGTKVPKPDTVRYSPAGLVRLCCLSVVFLALERA